MARMPETKAPADPIDARLVRRLAAILNATGLTEIEVERGDLRIKVARTPAPTMPALAAQAGPAPAPAAAPIAAAAPPASKPTGELVKSPMISTVYLQAQPSSP